MTNRFKIKIVFKDSSGQEWDNKEQAMMSEALNGIYLENYKKREILERLNEIFLVYEKGPLPPQDIDNEVI